MPQQDSSFSHRHIGPNKEDINAMLKALRLDSIDALIEATIPESIKLNADPDLPTAKSEPDTLSRLKELAHANKIHKSFIGMGYYDTHVPSVIARNVLENPGWYTAYTPYQAEISQGRLEALLNFQQMVIDLTAMDLANASLLDEATAAAEAMALCKRAGKSKSQLFFADKNLHPQTLDVLLTRAKYFGFELIVAPLSDLPMYDVFGVICQYPGTTGGLPDLEAVVQVAHEQGALVAVATDLLSLVLLKPPGELGADVVVGSAQRFGVPMGYGGPHAAFFATRETFKRAIPGRIIGVSVDSRGKTALRMAMQTREQHIRREKATSNICTAQALLANMAAFYAVYHGPEGLKRIAQHVHELTLRLAAGLKHLGFTLRHDVYFDTLCIDLESQKLAGTIYARALDAQINLRQVSDTSLGISLDETTTEEDVTRLWYLFHGKEPGFDPQTLELERGIPKPLERTSHFLSHPVFNRYQSETEMLRYLKRLENKDFSLTHGMIPLGSCTMKLNATTEMLPLTWPEFAKIHPFAPKEQTKGYKRLIEELEDWLLAITGYNAMSMQPNSGAQGEYAGLLAIRRYHEHLGQDRDVCLIPSSAHGTNPASAQMMGLKVVVIKTDEDGNIDLADLKAKAERYQDKLSCLMITYPSTHGVFEETVQEVCDLIHHYGGQVYLDGANLNALVGLSSPGHIGADVSHLNLHKTFCIPHGGGGPGMGPIGVKAQLKPFLPNHKVRAIDGLANNSAVSAAPFGSAAILPISWAYIYMMGAKGLKKASQIAILNANYLAQTLSPYYPVLYRGKNGYVAHECIVDIRQIRETTSISEEDIAKRLMDYGFHAPTMSWPVPGTMMIEPTESENKRELDRFCQAMIQIRQEIKDIELGEISAQDSPLKHAPHTLEDILDSTWQRAYSREKAVFPMLEQKEAKFWPSVNRIDNVYGDRNLQCTCPPMSIYEEEPLLSTE